MEDFSRLLKMLQILFNQQKQQSRRWEDKMETLISRIASFHDLNLEEPDPFEFYNFQDPKEDDRYTSKLQKLISSRNSENSFRNSENSFRNSEKINDRMAEINRKSKLEQLLPSNIRVTRYQNKYEPKIEFGSDLSLDTNLDDKNLDENKVDCEKIPFLKCEFCQMKFLSTSGLVKHNQKFHGDANTLKDSQLPLPDFIEEKQISSTFKKFKKKKIKSEEKEETFPCDRCPFQGKNSSALRSHKSDMHYEPPERTIKMCESCSYTTNENSRLQEHINFHHRDVFNFTCKYCDYRGLNGQKLGNHVKAVHDKLKNEQCDKCPATFSRRSNLQDHIKTVHEKLRAYHCDNCAFETNRKSALNVHMALHTRSQDSKNDESLIPTEESFDSSYDDFMKFQELQ